MIGRTIDEMKKLISLILNGKPMSLEADAARSLLSVLRNDLNLTGTKFGCGHGACGACTVIVDDKAVRSCQTTIAEVEGRRVLTIEGLASDGKLHPLQEAFIAHGAFQCGYCTPGMIMSAKAFLDARPNPTAEEIKRALAGNLCRCTGYVKIIEAVLAAAAETTKSRADG